MTHDEAVAVLKAKAKYLREHGLFPDNPSPFEQALDYAIAELYHQKLIKTRLAQIASGDYKACGHTAEEVAKTAIWELTGSTIGSDTYKIEPIDDYRLNDFEKEAIKKAFSAELERENKPTQFDVRIADIKQSVKAVGNMLMAGDTWSLLDDMQSHIRKLEANPKWNREI